MNLYAHQIFTALFTQTIGPHNIWTAQFPLNIHISELDLHGFDLGVSIRKFADADIVWYFHQFCGGLIMIMLMIMAVILDASI